MHHLLSFDPGLTTGFARIVVPDDGSKFELRECYEIPWSTRQQDLHKIFSDVTPEKTHIVIESFKLFPHKAQVQIGNEFPSSQMIGSIHTFCYLLGMPETQVTFQQPSEIPKVAVLDEHVQHVAGSPHQVDAYKHARLYYIKHFRNPFQAPDNQS